MKAYTIGIPVATVLFIALLIGSLVYVGGNKPAGDALSAESNAVLDDVRSEFNFMPRANADRTGVTVYLDADRNVTTLRVHGLMSRDLQTELVEHLKQARADNGWRAIIVNFHYPEARPETIPGQALIDMPTHAERPEAFRTERL